MRLQSAQHLWFCLCVKDHLLIWPFHVTWFRLRFVLFPPPTFLSVFFFWPSLVPVLDKNIHNHISFIFDHRYPGTSLLKQVPVHNDSMALKNWVSECRTFSSHRKHCLLHQLQGHLAIFFHLYLFIPQGTIDALLILYLLRSHLWKGNLIHSKGFSQPTCWRLQIKTSFWPFSQPLFIYFQLLVDICLHNSHS